jgi:hypothetical protein
MILSRTTFLKRVVAVVVISLTCFCLLEDLLGLGRCAEDQEIIVLDAGAATTDESNTAQESCPPNSSGGHDCLCCCRHVIAGVIFRPDQSWLFSFVELAPPTEILSAPAFPPYHPPQA